MKKEIMKNLAKVVVGLIKIAGLVAIFVIVNVWIQRDFSVPGEIYLFTMFASMFALFIVVSFLITKDFLLYGVMKSVVYTSLWQSIFVLFVKLVGIAGGVASALLYFKYGSLNDPYYIVRVTMIALGLLSLITAFARKEDILI